MGNSVLVADDHAAVRRGLREIILESPGWSEVIEACDFPDLFDRIQERRFDAVLMDVDMPGGDALDALGRIQRLRDGVPVLIHSVHPEDQFGLRMLRAGAAGYLAKDRAPDQLMEALGVVVTGGLYVTPALSARLAETMARGGDLPSHADLSDREFQVVRLIATGLSVSEIADELHLSSKTVSTYRSRALEKLGMSSNAELMKYAIRQNLV